MTQHPMFPFKYQLDYPVVDSHGDTIGFEYSDVRFNEDFGTFKAKEKIGYLVFHVEDGVLKEVVDGTVIRRLLVKAIPGGG